MKRAAALCLAAACFLSAGAAQASNINWSYQFVSSGLGGTHIITNHHAFGIVSLPDLGSGHLSTPVGTTTDISTKVWAFSTASASNPQTVNVPFTIDLKLSEHGSVPQYVSFSGWLHGTLWKNGANLSYSFTSPLTASVDIDHHSYTVTFESFKSPDGLFHPGKFTFDVSVQHNPEPSTLVLAALGVPFFGLALRRRYRRG